MRNLHRIMPDNNNKINQPFALIVIALITLVALSWAGSGKQIGGLKLKEIRLFSDIIKTPVDPATLAFNQPLKIKDSLSLSFLKKDSSNIISKAPEESFINFVSDTSSSLANFFNALVAAQKHGGKARIAYFGDSMIEGDLLTQDLRNLLQKRFGGLGVGFVPVTSPVSGFRRTIANSSSDDWQVYNLLHSDTISLHKPGISGHVFFPSVGPVLMDTIAVSQSASWVKYSSSNSYSTVKDFYKVKMYYGQNANGQNYLNYNFGDGARTQSLQGKQCVNEITLNDKLPKHYLTLKLNCSQPLPVYGLSFESDSGVFIDNYAFRGNSGLALTKMPGKVLRGFNTYFDYDLIVLQYGLNVANATMKDYSWYEAGMTRVINHLKNSFPSASFLIVSVGDKSYKNTAGYETDPSIPILVEAQKRIAQKTGAAFWNLYEAMGGYNSMLKWVEGDTVLANKDYTHLNHRGAGKIAAMLYQHLIKEFEDFEKGKKNS